MKLLLKIKSFWTSSIGRQLMLGIALVHAVLMTIFVFDLVHRQTKFLIQESGNQAEALAETLAANGTSWILANDIIGMEEVIHSQLKYPNLTYAMFLDLDGKVLAHTNNANVGLYIKDHISKKLLERSSGTIRLVDTSLQVDVAHSVAYKGKQIGWARVGISRVSIGESLEGITKEGVIYTFIAIFVGTVFAWFMGKGLTVGIQKLLLGAQAIQAGKKDIDLNLEREDELGEFSQALSATFHELNKAKQVIAKNEQRLNFALDGANAGIWDWKVGTDEIYYSPRFKKLLGVPDHVEMSSTKDWSDRIHPDDAENAWDKINEHLEGKKDFFENEQRVLHEDGTYHWALSRGKALFDEDGKALRMVGTWEDISERKELALQLSNRQKELERSNQYKTEFLMNTSHELRTPLNSVIGLTSLIADNAENNLTNEQLEFIKIVHDSGNHLLKTIDGILELSAIEAGRVKIVHDVIETDTLVDILREKLLQEVKEKQRHIDVSADANSPRIVMSDIKKLSIIFDRLIENAVKFTDNNGKINISIFEDNGSNQEQSEYCISVKDTGIGIPEENHQLIFNAFQQGDGSTTRKYGGSGLGLALSNAYAKLLGGRLTMVSEEGKGSDFCLRIPAQQNKKEKT